MKLEDVVKVTVILPKKDNEGESLKTKVEDILLEVAFNYGGYTTDNVRGAYRTKKGDIACDRSKRFFVIMPRKRIPSFLARAKRWARVLRQESLYVEISQPEAVFFVEPDRFPLPKTPPPGLVAPSPAPHCPEPKPKPKAPASEYAPFGDSEKLTCWFNRIDRESQEKYKNSLPPSKTFFLESIYTDIRNHGNTELPVELSAEIAQCLKDSGHTVQVYRLDGIVNTVVRPARPKGI